MILSDYHCQQLNMLILCQRFSWLLYVGEMQSADGDGCAKRLDEATA